MDTEEIEHVKKVLKSLRSLQAKGLLTDEGKRHLADIECKFRFLRREQEDEQVS